MVAVYQSVEYPMLDRILNRILIALTILATFIIAWMILEFI